MIEAQSELAALTDPALQGNVAMGVRDAKTIGDTEIRIRGEAEKLGPVVPRGFLTCSTSRTAPKINPKQSGRLELAQWLTSEKNPLTPRVMVNRVWQHLFGQGMVHSVDNFGVTGDVPSHPELLDYLANRFMQRGLVGQEAGAGARADAGPISSAREATAATTCTVDPANRLVWRHGPRRLEAEEIRDAMLAAAGTLDLHPPEASPRQRSQGDRDAQQRRRCAKQHRADARESHAPERLPALAPRRHADVAGGLRLRRARDGHGQPRRDDGRHAGVVPAQRPVRPPAVADTGRAAADRSELDDDGPRRLWPIG